MAPKGFTDARSPAAPFAAPAAVSRSQRVSNVTAWPTSAVGRLFFSNQAETAWYSCSATSIVTDSPNAVWTAAHCLHGPAGPGWFTNYIFIPADSGSDIPYGYFQGVNLIAHNEWTSGSSDRRQGADMGIVIVTPGSGQSLSLSDTVGAWGYRFLGETGFSNARSFGYPSDGYNRPDSDFSQGDYMMYCEGNTADAANGNPLDNRLRMACDMGHGASGGPMAINVGTSPQIMGTNSHRAVDTNDNFIDNWLNSSNHGLVATALIRYVNDNW